MNLYHHNIPEVRRSELEAMKYICKVMGLEPTEKQNHSVIVNVLRPGAVNKPLTS